MSKSQAGRPRKLSNWTLLNALADGRKAKKSVRQIARELHVHPDTLYATAKYFEINIPLVLRGIPPESWQTRPSNGELPQGDDSQPLTPEEIRILKVMESTGWRKHECADPNCCSMCLRARDAVQADEGQYESRESHLVDARAFGIAASQRRQPNKLAMSYGPAKYCR